MVVDEITCHCDILARIMQEYSGETMAHEARVRVHMQRMERSPIRRVRACRRGSVPALVETKMMGELEEEDRGRKSLQRTRT